MDKDGRIIFVRSSSQPIYKDGQIVGITGLMTDITERRKAEEAVRASEEKFKSIIEHVTDIFYIQNANREIIYISPQTEQVLGYKPEEMQHGWQKYLTDNPMNQAGPEKSQMAFTTSEKQAPYLLEFMHRDGTKRLAEINESPLKNDKGEVIGMVGAARDMTEREEAEILRAESEAKYRSLVETAGAGIATIDLDGKFTFANARVCQWAGLAKADILGKPFANYVHPDDLPGLAEMFLNAVGGESAGPTFEFRIINADGQITWLYTNPTSAILDGKTIGFNAILIDITERKMAEDALRTSESKFSHVFYGSPFPLSLTRVRDGVLVEINDAWTEKYGYTRSEACGKTTAELGISTNPEERAHIYTLLQEKGNLHNIEVTGYRTKDNPAPIFLVNFETLEFGGEKYVLTTAQDITEYRKAEQALKASEAQYRLLSEHTTDTVWLMDMNLKIMYHSPSVEKLRGFTTQEINGNAAGATCHTGVAQARI